MNSLFDKWKTRIPKYSEKHKDLFSSLSQKYGAEGEKKISLGKHFSTNYELYIFAFFIGLYRNEYSPIPKDEKKTDFSHHIQHWGSKTTISTRSDFTNIQENIFMALVAKTDIDLIALEKGEIEEDDAVKSLIYTMESYTNGGLILIKERLEEKADSFRESDSFLKWILDSADVKIQLQDITVIEDSIDLGV
jgi:hypothetical protein